ncbi:MAG: ABC-2 transporter permease, partial [Clostridium sp.]|nr:ABC-2 transporter permease [Clostridium sp.]
IFASLILMYVLYGINILNSARVMVLQDIVVSIVTILLSFGIIIPIIYKYGYRIGRIIAPIITIFIGYMTFKNSSAYEFINTGKETLLISFSRKIGRLIYNIFNLKTYDYKVMSMNVYLILIFVIALVLFIISMYISLKIYKNKDLA